MPPDAIDGVTARLQAIARDRIARGARPAPAPHPPRTELPMRRSAPLLLAALLWGACAPPAAPPRTAPAGPEPEITETSSGISFRLRNDDAGATHHVGARADRVRALLPEVFRDLGVAGAGMDREGLVFGHRSITAPRVGGERPTAWVRCGNQSGAGPSAASSYRTQLSLLVTIRPDGERTWVTTQVGGSATPVAGTSTEAVMCVSTGRLEKRVEELLAARLAASGANFRAR